MKKFTMVMRTGNPKANSVNMIYTLIGEDYSFAQYTGQNLAKAIMDGKIEVTNLGISDKGLVSTNGALKNYTLVNEYGQLVGAARAVILNRVETDKGLVGYTIYNLNGVLQEVTIATAVELAKSELIANGKVRPTSNGEIVASIKGDYPIRTIKINDTTLDKTIKVNVLFFGSMLAGQHNTKYAGIMIDGANAASVSKLYDPLCRANKKLIDKVKEVTGVDEAKSFGIQRTGTAGFYGVYPLATVFEVFEKADNKVSLLTEKIVVGATDYDADREESRVGLNLSFKAVDGNSGTDKADKAVKEYAAKLIEKLKSIKFEVVKK